MNLASFNYAYDPGQMDLRDTKIRKEAKEWIMTMVYVAIFYIIFTTAFIEPYLIPSNSMKPTLNGDPNFFIGDRILALKWISKLFPFERGDIVIFYSVEDMETFIVKRLVGLPGDTIEIKEDNRVWVNGKSLENHPSFKGRNYYTFPIQDIKNVHSPEGKKTLRYHHCYGDNFYSMPGVVYTVPKDCFFVMGDNSASSNDSRFWGHLPISHVMGKAIMVWWPLKRAGMLK